VRVGLVGIVGIVLLYCVVEANGKIDPMAGRNEMMSVESATKRWGKTQFDEAKFRAATAADRAKMAVDLVSRNPYVGMSPAELKIKLGEYTGYYWSHRIPAYLIEEGWAKKSDTWQIVFLLGMNGLVKEVKIHKNCCYVSTVGSPRDPTESEP
jgi:hypothetical protein